jgi:hypothetical protein
MQHKMAHYTTAHHRPFTHDGTLYHNTSQTIYTRWHTILQHITDHLHTMAHYTTTHHRPCNTRWHTIPQHIADHATQYHTLYRNIAQTIQHSITHYIAPEHRPFNTVSHTISHTITDHATRYHTLSNKP